MTKQEKIVDMFNTIAPKYDLANRVISFGIDKSWRKTAVDFVLKKYANQSVGIVDMACGTGDMIGWWLDRSKHAGVSIKQIIGVDPSEGMLGVAKQKLATCGNVQLKCSLAHESGLEDKSADIISISYGIRNVVERAETLKEFNRILQPGGHLLVLEFTKRDKKGFVSFFRDLYVRKVLPGLGGLVGAGKEAYDYLPESIEGFLDNASFKAELENAGFAVEATKSFCFGVTTMFVAKKVG